MMGNIFEDTLEQLRAAGNYRSLGSGLDLRGDAVDLSSNDYLGIAAKGEIADEFFAQAGVSRLMTSSASRLLSAHQSHYASLESYLSSLYEREVLLFNSGYHANSGAIAALAAGRSLIVADKLVHASIIDGIVLSRAKFARFRHNDLDHLESILSAEAGKYENVVIVTESVFSMDGDICDLQRLVAIKRRWPNAILYVDEAHGLGVFGERGLGVAEQLGLVQDIDLIVGTFGKACASSGAFVATSKVIKEYLVNRARSLIFSTALPPINCAFTEFVMRKIVDMTAERAHLMAISKMLYEVANGLNAQVATVKSQSQIVPWIIGDSRQALAESERLRSLGFVALPIRTPTVPAGTERIRFSLSAALPSNAITRLINCLRRDKRDW